MLFFYRFTFLLFSCFPLNRHYSIKSTTSFTYRALLLVAFPIAVLLPKIAITLTISTLVPATFQHLRYTPAGTYQSWGNFYCSFFLTHIQSTILFSNIVICFIFLSIALAKKNSAKAPGLSCQSGSRQMISHRFSCIMSRRSISS